MCISKELAFYTTFEKSHPAKQLFDNCKLHYLLSALTATPSHTSKATVAGTREEEGNKRTGRHGKDAAVLCIGHSGARWFFCPSLKKKSRMYNVKTTSHERLGAQEKKKKNLDQE